MTRDRTNRDSGYIRDRSKTVFGVGATIGILGGGQLGRMFTVAAKTMGYRVTVLDPDPIAPARVREAHFLASDTFARQLAEQRVRLVRGSALYSAQA